MTARMTNLRQTQMTITMEYWMSTDAFPLDSSESVDTDNDGTGDNADTDDDDDSVLDADDAFPLDSN